MSVYVEYDPWGRMGNRMFQYAFGAILAKLKNTTLLAPALPNFNIPSTSTERAVNNPIYTRMYGNNYVNLKELIETDRDVVVNSFVQKSKYYIEHKQFLKQLFNIQDQPFLNKNKLVIHIRETDYENIGCFLGYECYKQLINSTSFNDIIIVTDNSECDTVQRLVNEGCTIFSKGYVNEFCTHSNERSMTDFAVLLYSENIAISQSSFSWWAGFLGEHKQVIFPFLEKIKMWNIRPQQDDVDLYYDLGYSLRYVN